DSAGARKEANIIDNFIQKKAEGIYDVVGWKDSESDKYDYKKHHSQQVREPKRDGERVDYEGRSKHHIENYEHREQPSLSSRYCPDHIGVQMGRVGESTYQCPLDGKVYNWDTGFKTYDGVEYEGGSVAGQTPDSSGYGIPHRVFDTRQTTINSVN